MPLVFISTPKSMLLKLVAVGTSLSSTVQLMSSPMSRITVTSLPAMASHTSPGTSISPFMSMVMVSPLSASAISSRMSSQPSLLPVLGPSGFVGGM